MAHAPASTAGEKTQRTVLITPAPKAHSCRAHTPAPAASLQKAQSGRSGNKDRKTTRTRIGIGARGQPHRAHVEQPSTVPWDPLPPSHESATAAIDFGRRHHHQPSRWAGLNAERPLHIKCPEAQNDAGAERKSERARYKRGNEPAAVRRGGCNSCRWHEQDILCTCPDPPVPVGPFARPRDVYRFDDGATIQP